MKPDRMVIDEARRTFTYLNLYGYLTDAVVVNRVFPEEVGDVLRRLARAPARGAGRGPVRLRAGAGAAGAVLRRGGRRRRRCSTASAASCSTRARPGRACCTSASRRSSWSAPTRPSCAWTCRSPQKGEISLKKIGLELVVARRRAQAHDDAAARAGRLPADRRPFDDGALDVTFDGPA